LIKERPIGRHPTSPDDESYLCPNDLSLGRSTSRVPRGPFLQTDNPRHKYEFIQKVWKICGDDGLEKTFQVSLFNKNGQPY